MQFAKTWYVVSKSKSSPITACPTFSGPKSQYCSTKWQARYHNTGKKSELQLKTQDACKSSFDVEKGSHITRSFQVRHERSIQNSTSQNIQVLKMHYFSVAQIFMLYLNENYLITNSCTIRIRTKVSVISLYMESKMSLKFIK